jgi:RNA polymerase sigma-70 factor, ECF subfamily
LVYDQLRGIAEAYLRKERPDHTLQPTAVVNEVFVDLLRLRRVALNDRAHFFTFAAQLIRRILIDSARKAKSEKRGVGWQRIRWTPNWPGWAAKAPSRWIFPQALNDLAEFDPVKTRTVELHYFLGCTVDETAEILEVSAARSNATCVFPWPGWASGCARPERATPMRPAELERFRKVEEIFHAALELPPGAIGTR